MNDKASLIDALDQAHRTLADLVLSLSDRQRNVPYHPGINPPTWEWGHAAFFFEIFLLRELDNIDPIMPSMDNNWDSFNLDHKDRWQPGVVPSVKETQEYVEAVYQRIRQRIECIPLTPKDLYLYKYCIFHQYMHIESLVWCRQTLGYPAPALEKKQQYYFNTLPVLEDAVIPAGDYFIGQPADLPDFAGENFSFDAEKPGFTRHLDEFHISKTLVSRGEFLNFIQDGGYERSALWSFGGKKWLAAQRTRDVDMTRLDTLQAGPIYWRKQNGVWQERVFDQWQPLNLAAPLVHVTYWESEAWCHWAGRRLPTEFEWEAAALGNRADDSKMPPFRSFPWGRQMDSTRVDMDRACLAQCPVSAFEQGQSPFGLIQCIGTAWEWTSTQFLPYHGFKVDMYPYMSTLQFGYHKVTRGGSCATSSNLIRGTYRQAYLPFRRDVFVGFRTCQL